jgi:hypothetical protein
LKKGNDGKLDTLYVNLEGAKCLVLGDSIARNVGTDKANMRVE